MPALSIDNEDDDKAHFQVDLAHAIVALKVNLLPTTSIISLFLDPSQITNLEMVSPSTSTVASHPNFSFLAEWA